jgi:hypothetical protein
MAILHHNYGVSEHSDPLDVVLWHTVVNLEHTPKIPGSADYPAPHGVMHEDNMSEWPEHEGFINQ